MADVKPIKITADVSQAEAEFQRLKAAYGEVTEAEEKFLRKVAESETQLKAKKQAADGLGVSMGSLSSALRQTSQETGKHAEGIDLSKKGLRDFNDILETSTGLHIKGAGAIGETITKLGPFAAAALAVGAAIDVWKEQEKQLDEALKEADRSVEDQAVQIEKLRAAHLSLDDIERQNLARMREIKAEKFADEWDEQARAIQFLSIKQDAANALTGDFGPIIAALAGPIGFAARAWADLTGKVDDYNREMEHLTLAEKNALVDAHERRDARLKLRQDEEKARIASMSREERAAHEHNERLKRIMEEGEKSGDAALQIKAIAAENARWRKEEEGFRQHQAHKTAAAVHSANERRAKVGKIATDLANFEIKEEQRVQRAFEQSSRRIQTVQMNVAKAIEKYEEQTARDRIRINREMEEMAREQKMMTLNLEMQAAQASIGAASAVFGKNKAIAYADAIVGTARAVVSGLNTQPFMPLGIAMAALAAATGIAQIQKISSTNVSGQAHSGMGNVPQSGTYNLLAGEMVLDPSAANTMREVSNAMRNVKPGASNSVVVNFHGTVVGGRQAGREITKMVRSAVRSANLRVA